MKKKTIFVALLLLVFINIGLMRAKADPTSTLDTRLNKENSKLEKSGELATNVEKVSLSIENEPEDFGPIPSRTQLDYYDQELAAFMHYGPNTFTGLEWGNSSYTINSYQGKEFHAEDMVKVLSETGFKRLIITAKHHDGFVLYKSAFTDFDVESSTYKGDILEELSAAASKYNLDMGLYLSPWDIHEPSYGYGFGGNESNDKNGDYNEYYINQIREINKNDKYGNKGQFIEWWMDGAKGQGENAQDYDFENILEAIREDNDEILIFGAVVDRGGVHWVGNERGIANVDQADPTIPANLNEGEAKRGPKHLQTDKNGEVYWSVPEADVSLTSGWFWGPGKSSPKSMKDLANIYFNSVGHGVPLLLNMAPNAKGTYDQAVVDRLYEFKHAIDETFKDNLAEGAKISASNVRDSSGNFAPENMLDKGENAKDTYWTTEDGVKEAHIDVDFGEKKEFDIVSIQEYIEKGLRIYEFSIQYQGSDGTWKDFGSGRGIGAKRLVRRSPVRSSKIRINIRAKEVPIIDTIGVFKASEKFELGKILPEGISTIEDKDFDLTGIWGQDQGPEYTNNSAVWSSDKLAKLSFKFTGSKFYVIGTIDPGHGDFEVIVDGVSQGVFNTNGPSRKVQQKIYESDLLEDKEHHVVLKPKTKALGVDCIHYIGSGSSLFEIESDDYVMNEKINSTEGYKVKIKRVGDISTKASVQVTTPPSSAVQGQYYVDINKTLEFNPGEREKTVEVFSIDNDNTQDHKDFFLELSDPKGAYLGFNHKIKIILLDDETLANEMKIEAEDFNLEERVSGEKPNSINKNIRVSESNEASGGKIISWFETGNAMNKDIDFKEAGIYTVTMRYQSGRPTDGSNNNFMVIKGGNGVIEKEIDVPGGGSQVPWTDLDFEIEVSKAGRANLRFVADSRSCPNIDYFIIKKK